MDAILVINAGSSSLKFQIFGIDNGALSRRVRGQLDGIGTRPRLKATVGGGPSIDKSYDAAEIPDLPTAIRTVRTWLQSLSGFNLVAVGHRVVHGGPDFAKPVVIDREILEHLTRYEDLAPLHQPNNLAPIRLVMEQDPRLPQVACFDTAFHRTHSRQADIYALPLKYYEEGVRRYGFHGLSYEYVSQRLNEIAPSIAKGRVIIAHLGSGVSMCAVKNGQSIESSMGFTALDGLVMGTRPGQIDPGVILYLVGQKGMSAAEVSDLLYRDSGLKGLSGIGNDMRDLLASGDPRARFAVEHFVHRGALQAGLLASALEGLDGFVFTAGIGENSPEIRAMIAHKLKWMGLDFDAGANERGETEISKPQSRVKAYVVPTNEELMIARHTLALIKD
ncbi:MAG: acetate kinase [Rhizobiales bacterium]|nr:acetate kinase [Hyphomicrobiales bacterium]